MSFHYVEEKRKKRKTVYYNFNYLFHVEEMLTLYLNVFLQIREKNRRVIGDNDFLPLIRYRKSLSHYVDSFYKNFIYKKNVIFLLYNNKPL